MKIYRLLIGALLLMANGACDNTLDGDDDYEDIGDGVKLGRVAVIEHRFTTDTDCESAAQRFARQNPGSNLVQVQSSPLVYSAMSPETNGRKALEVRFGTASDTITISYRQVKRGWPFPRRRGDEKHIGKAIEVLEGQGAKVDGVVRYDDNPINGKQAFRVVLKSDKPIVFSAQRLVLEKTFGLVINPPYP